MEWKSEKWLKENKRTKYLIGWVIVAGVLAWYSAYLDRQVAIRSHNLDVFYKSLTCDDLPLKQSMDLAACEQAIGHFMLPENKLFTR